ncbi:MAG TPA: Holliday junction branch migration protein RuvA [Candidatus Paceibacterota bacterium]
MISHLRGSVIRREETYIVIDVSGVGYKVRVTGDTLNKLASIGEKPLSIHTYLVVREDALDLYGFVDAEELAFFELLIGISGIGPKTALGILNLAPVKTIKNAVISGDPLRLSKTSGISKKNAEKIVLELKSKFEGVTEEGGGIYEDESDALDALQGLGYSEKQAREALKKLDKSITGTGEKVKAALKQIGK